VYTMPLFVCSDIRHLRHESQLPSLPSPVHTPSSALSVLRSMEIKWGFKPSDVHVTPQAHPPHQPHQGQPEEDKGEEENNGCVLVGGVLANSAAERAGLADGMKILSINGRRIYGVDDFHSFVEEFESIIQAPSYTVAFPSLVDDDEKAAEESSRAGLLPGELVRLEVLPADDQEEEDDDQDDEEAEAAPSSGQPIVLHLEVAGRFISPSTTAAARSDSGKKAAGARPSARLQAEAAQYSTVEGVRSLRLIAGASVNGQQRAAANEREEQKRRRQAMQ